MGLNPGYAILEFYVSLVTYTVMHMIFVISSDFVEAFSIPPLNIGIYVDKLAAIRALLMVIADILEWAITQEWLHDPGAYKKLSTPSERRIASVMSFFIMWLCRVHYIWILYFSDNRSLITFINMSIEGFWFGVFQMSFFAVGPEYNAFTSLAIHTMGNFIFFTQVLLNKLARKYPSINCLCRVRVHGWVCLVISTIALGPWVYFCNEYTKGNTPEYRELVAEHYWFETDTFNALVGDLQEYLELKVGSETSLEAASVAKKIRESLRDAGSEKYKLLVEELKKHITSPNNLNDAGNLQSALNKVTDKIQELVNTEFKEVTGVTSNSHVQVQQSGGTTVNVTLGSSGSENAMESQLLLRAVLDLKIQIKKQGTVTNLERDNATKIALRLAKACRDAAKQVENANFVEALLQKDFGIEKTETVKVEVSTNVEVKIKDSSRSQGTAQVNVTKGSSVPETITIKICKQDDLPNANDIANRLAKAAALAASWVPTLSSFTVKRQDEDNNKVKEYLTGKLRDSGSEKFKELVEELKRQGGFNESSENLNADNLRTALSGVKDTHIKNLLENEFQVTVTNATSNITVNADKSKNKVTVTITGTTTGSKQHKGYSLVKQNADKKITENIQIEVKLTGNTATLEKAEKIAKRLAKAVKTAKFKTTANLVEALVKKEFGIDKTVKVEGNDTNVEVKIGSGNNTQHTETVKVDTSTNITIEVKGNDSDIAKPAARRVARRLAKTLIDFGFPPKNKFKGFEIKMDEIKQHNVWSPFLLFIIGAFAEDFAVPGVLPFAFLDPEKANLVNYLTPLFFFTGAFIILLLNDVFSGEQSVLMEGIKEIRHSDSQFKEWSEGAASGWHAMWFFNVPKYLAFFIAMWSIHGTFERLRCIIQSRWRVLLLTMFIVVPRATLEVAGYVGVANFAIAQGETLDFYGFKFIAWHDMIAMFCRFVYGKFAVGYNSI